MLTNRYLISRTLVYDVSNFYPMLKKKICIDCWWCKLQSIYLWELPPTPRPSLLLAFSFPRPVRLHAWEPRPFCPKLRPRTWFGSWPLSAKNNHITKQINNTTLTTTLYLVNQFLTVKVFVLGSIFQLSRRVSFHLTLSFHMTKFHWNDSVMWSYTLRDSRKMDPNRNVNNA